MTDHYAVIGNPIGFSKSPLIHGMFAQATGQNMEYTKIEGPLGRFAETVDAFRARGARGMNITAPFKLDAFNYATDSSDRAKLAGAANAVKFEGDRVFAENFDGVGLMRDVVHNLQCSLQGKRVLLLGAGGAARGALLPLLAESPATLVIANRTVSKAQELAHICMLNGASIGVVRACDFAGLADASFDVVFNATSASLRAELPAVPASAFGAGCLAYELAYGKGLTPFLQLAQQAGAGQLADGVGMLVEQAAQAFEWWRGVRPDTHTVIHTLTIPLV